MTNIILPSILLFSSLIFCQVNTEAMRAENLSAGIHQKMNMSFSYISGNSEIMILRGDYRIDYQSQSDWSGHFITKYDRAFEKSEDDFTNKGFGQLRAVKQVFPRIQVESFLQKEFNYFIDLENRELIGGNVRFNPFKKFFIATGTMYEKEEYKNHESSSINHFYEKLLLLKERMNTKTGKFMANNRHNAMEDFLKQFYEEWDGNL